MATIKESQHLCIPFQVIDVATKKFTTVIGKGGYGLVYKGELLLSGSLTTVAIKRLNSSISGQGFKEFLTEIKLLSRYKHPNLITLLGFCEDGNEKILIYEYAMRGSLDKYLSEDNKPTCPLTWTQRINICIDVARGLDYLHNHAGKNHRVIHRDIKSANILIDENWRAMISDLGLSKIGHSNENDSYIITNASGTHGYCDPAYWDTGILTKESDVYSFGVVLFEVLCGRLCFMNVHNEQRFLDRLAQRYYKTGRLNEIIDIELKNQVSSSSIKIVADIAYQCLQYDREKRPSMRLVVEKLEEARELEIEPIPSGNLPPGCDPNTCRSVYVGNVHPQVTKPLLQEVFASVGPVEGCKLIRKDKSSNGFIHYFDHRSAALAILSLNGRHLYGQPIKVDWAYASGQGEDTPGHFNIFVGDLSPEVTDAMLFTCFSVYASCSDARVMSDQKTGHSRGFGFVSFRDQLDAQSAINELTGKWLGSSQLRCNWATKCAGTSDEKQGSDSKNVVELTNGSSEDSKQLG